MNSATSPIENSFSSFYKLAALVLFGQARSFTADWLAMLKKYEDGKPVNANFYRRHVFNKISTHN